MRTGHGAIHGSVHLLPRVPTRNPAITKEQMGALGDLGHVTNFALAHHPPGSQCGSHDHKDMDEIFLVWEGAGTIEVDGISFQVERGDFFLIPVGVEHNIIADAVCADFVVLCIGVRARGHEHTDAAMWAERESATPD